MYWILWGCRRCPGDEQTIDTPSVCMQMEKQSLHCQIVSYNKQKIGTLWIITASVGWWHCDKDPGAFLSGFSCRSSFHQYQCTPGVFGHCVSVRLLCCVFTWWRPAEFIIIINPHSKSKQWYLTVTMLNCSQSVVMNPVWPAAEPNSCWHRFAITLSMLHIEICIIIYQSNETQHTGSQSFIYSYDKKPVAAGIRGQSSSMCWDSQVELDGPIGDWCFFLCR